MVVVAPSVVVWVVVGISVCCGFTGKSVPGTRDDNPHHRHQLTGSRRLLLVVAVVVVAAADVMVAALGVYMLLFKTCYRCCLQIISRTYLVPG